MQQERTRYKPLVVTGTILIATSLALWTIHLAFGQQAIQWVHETGMVTFSQDREQSTSLVEWKYARGDILLAKWSLYGFAIGLLLIIPINLQISALSVFILVGVLEVGFKVHDTYLSYKYPSTEGESTLWVYDPQLGWKKGANLNRLFTNKNNRIRTEVVTNAKGLRDDDYAYDKAPDVKRILLLGDSVVVGLEVDKGDLIDTQLEHFLSKHGKYEVINAGTRGYGTDQSYLFFQNEGYKYQPEIVIYVFVANDLTNNVTIHKPNRKFGKSYYTVDEKGALRLTGVPVPTTFSPHDKWLMSNKAVENAYNQADDRQREQSVARSIKNDLASSRLMRWIFRRIQRSEHIRGWLASWGFLELKPHGTRTRGNSDPDAEFVLDHEWDMTKRLIKKMVDFSQAKGMRFIVYEFTSIGERNPARKKLQQLSEQLGVQYFNSFKEFYENSKGGKALCFPYDGHWNAKGHQLAAQGIYTYLAREGHIETRL